MMSLEKLHPEHRRRSAFVYVRQSTMAQVFQHRTSTERQCALGKLAIELGWAPPQVDTLTTDLGNSGKFSENRDGFQRLTSEISLGHVGAIFSTEVSRLARSSADWHRLIEIAGLTRTVLIDEHAVYDPRDPNDRLVLGMKGTMAEFELVWLRQRMEEGKRYLANQGKLRVRPPVGYLYQSGRLVIDPDEEVQRAVRLLFERFRVSQRCPDVARYFKEHGLRFPSRRASPLTWSRLTRARVHEVISNPRYAGAYVHGRTHAETIFREGRRQQSRQRLAISEWPVKLHGAHPAYLPWEEFMANQKRLRENAPRRERSLSRGAPSKGAALLSGMLICGRCGNRLNVGYAGDGGRYPKYECGQLNREGLGPRCVRVPARAIDNPIVELVLGVLSSEDLGAATQVEQLIEQEEAALDEQWKLRMERARYEAKRLERQYDACEPENRVVARTLETRWNAALMELEKLEHEHEDVRRQRRVQLTAIDRRRIAELSKDLPRLWRAETTTDRDRKMLLRILVKDVSVTPIDLPNRTLRLKVLWHTQAICELDVERPASRWDRIIHWRMVTPPTPPTFNTIA